MIHYNTYERLFGLIGYPLSHSFSKHYFAEKYKREDIKGCFYELFPLERIEQIRELVKSYPNLVGLNVTIPYKETVLPFLDSVEEDAAKVGAVNTIKIKDGRLIGFNTDVYGFEHSLLNLINDRMDLNTLVLGTGGAAKAVGHVLDRLDISYSLVSRKPATGVLSYQELDKEIIRKHQLIINTTPLGMSPKTESLPALPYDGLSAEHFLFDLVYNPEETSFMQKGKEKDARVKNGLEMLHLQAEKAWHIWNN